MARVLSLALSLSLCACAAASRNDRAAQSSKRVEARGLSGERPMFVGHGNDGETVVAASHYDAMNGLALGAGDLGVTGGSDPGGEMTCKRETITGTHVPQWICRFQAEVEQERIDTRRVLDSRPKTCTSGCNQ